MKQQLFEEKYQAGWLRFREQLLALEGQADQAISLHQFAQQYRKVCYDLALAKERHYSPQLVDYLNDLALRGHQQLYHSNNSGLLHRFLAFVLGGFPQAVRKEWRMVLLGMALFYLPALLFGAIIYFNPPVAFSFFSAEQINQFSDMYNPAMHESMREARGSSDDLAMFGFYIKNNIGIGFQTFAGGILLGLGSLFFLLYNGLAIGGVAGYLTQLGYIDSFYTFVIGHGAFELTAIGIAGAAGMKMGFALIMPGQLSRRWALVQGAKEAIPLVYGVILFLLIAAFIEAFWSPAAVVANSIKYAVGAGLWLFVLLYLTLAGRARSQ